jgi:hypothetical protein
MKVPPHRHRSDRQSSAALNAVTVPHCVEMPIDHIEQPIHGVRGARCSRTIIRRQKCGAAGAKFLDHHRGDACQMRLRPFPQAARPLREAAFVVGLINPPGFVENHPAQLAPATITDLEDRMQEAQDQCDPWKERPPRFAGRRPAIRAYRLRLVVGKNLSRFRDGRVEEAAKKLGLSRSALHEKIKKQGFDLPRIHKMSPEFGTNPSSTFC